MARRKKKQITIKDPESLAILGVICLVFSALIFLSLFVEQSPTIDWFKRYFGWGRAVMALALFAISIRLFGTKAKYNSFKVIFFLIIFMFCFEAWIHLFPDFRIALKEAEAGRYGGIIGYNLSQFAQQNLTFGGAFITLTIFMVASFLLSLDVSPSQIGDWIVRVISFVRDIILFIKKIFTKIFRFFINSKDKIDQIEMNLARTENKKSKGLFFRHGNQKDDLNLQNIDPDSLSIKMVSDISGKKEIPNLNKTEINVSPNAAVHPKSEKVESKGEKKDQEELDLSIRMYPDWQLPPLDLLDPLNPKESESEATIKKKARAIEETLRSFNIEAKIAGYTLGPSVTQFFIDPAAGVKFTKIASLSKDLALTLASPSDLRIELIPGTSYIGIDVPNDKRQFTQLRESVTPIFNGKEKLNLGMAVGIDTGGKPLARDLQKMPHLLVAGATGMGKSVLVNAFIVSLLLQKSPDELKFIMIDPKMVEMAPYDGIPHLLTSPITDMSKASTALKWAVNEMEERYKTLKEAKARNIEQYITETGNLMPYIIVIIDEFSDLMMQFRAEVESSIIRLAQKSRAVGIHLIVATQRPTADVITGLIRSNIPARVALTVATGLDSRVILDTGGAETLLGRGDLLFKTANDLKPFRIQGLYMPDSEFNRIINFIKEQAPDVEYNEDQILVSQVDTTNVGGSDNISDDPLFKQAAEIVVHAQKGSASLLQTKMKIGYARAARLIDELEMAGIVGPQDGPRPREILVTDLESFLAAKSELTDEGIL